ncbi:TetR/AcrR family transcriptional regulator [Mesorhizobium koreense]|jgi:AcrR family transcriptional regulator|uniref:TetR/AcrR family transcriptional regulator n=1 Tax=Mesorhizobium koreense TaxID=3074855 RepID=UPI00287BC18B|nr:TetR/AcrR family transcriptional regulator [Mesorhizobium sp. WR6]
MASFDFVDEGRSRPAAVGNVKATREDWLEAALDTLISDGVESVRILTLGQKLGVSRSSFYWYFESRQDLLDQLLELWRNKNTRFIVERALRPAPSITQGVLNVFECWVDQRLYNPRLDFAIRAWARHSADVRAIIDDADNERLEAIHQMFLRQGYHEPDAFVRARVLYFMQIGYYSLEIMEPMKNRLSLVPAYLRSFTGREPLEGEVEAFAKFVEEVDAG